MVRHFETTHIETDRYFVAEKKTIHAMGVPFSKAWKPVKFC